MNSLGYVQERLGIIEEPQHQQTMEPWFNDSLLSLLVVPLGGL